MLEKYQSLELTDHVAMSRFELVVEGHVAFIDYKTFSHHITLLHTEVPKVLEGRGVAAALVEKAFLYLEAHGKKVMVRCPYIIAFLEKHPEWKRLLIGGNHPA